MLMTAFDKIAWEIFLAIRPDSKKIKYTAGMFILTQVMILILIFGIMSIQTSDAPFLGYAASLLTGILTFLKSGMELAFILEQYKLQYLFHFIWCYLFTAPLLHFFKKRRGR